ncbi:MAG TPA: hypothetical protein DCQ58_03515 [Saprospirales bacterium]|nr:hypothetical protein [Saprospirales bacterium]
MDTPVKKSLNPRKTFWKCGACSHAMFHLLNHEFDNNKSREEKASDMLAGGIAQKGHQCGMLWGVALAAGAEAYKRYYDKNMAVATAIHTSQLLVESFKKRTRSANCRDIAKVNWESKFERTLYTIKALAKGMVFSPCFNLMVKWTPEAVKAANHGLSENIKFKQPCFSCSTELIKKMGGSEEESVMVAGFAGGLGLSGHACGALSAAIWYKMLNWEKYNEGKTQQMFHNPDAKKVLEAFYSQTNSEVLCKIISQTSFNTIDEHTEYLRNGGCRSLIEALATS